MPARGVPDNRFSLARADASEQIAYEIRRHIERQGLLPGDRIGTEQELAAEFGVSRPTLREALRLLAGSHLIRASQGRGGGIFVANTAGEGMGRNMSEAIATMLATESVSLHQLLQARMVLEVPLAGLAAANAGKETIAELESGHRGGRGQAAGLRGVQPGGPELPRRDRGRVRQRPAGGVHALDPRRAAAVADPVHRPGGHRREHPAPAHGDPRGDPQRAARRRRAGDARAPRSPRGHRRQARQGQSGH